MTLVVHAVLFTVFAWWFTTGVIIYLDGLPRRTFALSMTVATVMAGLALHGLAATSADTTVLGAYLAFGFALVAWGWNEMGFLMGIITGPRTTEMPADATGLRRLGFAIQAVIHHEIAIAATAVAIAVVVGDGPNQIGLWTFLALWVMRLSAKINVYLGVPNITEEFLPPHLVYLKTYFRIRPMNAVFPVSITVLTLAAAFVCSQARLPGATPFDVTAATLLGTLIALALVEHWFMVLPIPSTKLWDWGLASHAAHAAAHSAVQSAVTKSAAIDPGTITASITASITAAVTPTVVVPTPALVATFHKATSPVTATVATIVPFPTSPQSSNPTAHRRRP